MVYKSSIPPSAGVTSLNGLLGDITLVAGAGFPYAITTVGQEIVFDSPLVGTGYVAEDGTTLYVTEDGLNIYIPEGALVVSDYVAEDGTTLYLTENGLDNYVTET